MTLSELSRADLEAALAGAHEDYQAFADRGLRLDITRGKPSAQQLDLAAPLLTNVTGDDCLSPSGVDVRNYGGLEGLIELRELFGELLGIPAQQLLAQGNSSLTLMHQALSFACLFGTSAETTPWAQQPRRILCPVPGYDRHFALAEALGFELVSVAMDEEGPDIDQVEQLVATDPTIKGMWLVPMYSNPTGVTLSAARAERLVGMKTAAEDFRLLWDNAYALHHLRSPHAEVLDILSMAAKAGNPDRVWVFASTSKITHAGAGVAFFGSSAAEIAWFTRHLGAASIGPDKINQLRHLRFFKDADGVRRHMEAHAEILRPKFEAVTRILTERLGADGIASWTDPNGGYFVTVSVMPGTAERVVKLADEAGVKLTPAGSTHPYMLDPDDCVIRVAPSMPTLDEVETAVEGFAACARLAACEKLLAEE